MRPNGQPQVEHERVGLCEQIIPRRNAEPEASGRAARAAAACDKKGEEKPRCSERGVVARARAERGGKFARDERAIVEQHREWRGDHDFLRRHARETKAGRQGQPPGANSRRAIVIY